MTRCEFVRDGDYVQINPMAELESFYAYCSTFRKNGFIATDWARGLHMTALVRVAVPPIAR